MQSARSWGTVGIVATFLTAGIAILFDRVTVGLLLICAAVMLGVLGWWPWIRRLRFRWPVYRTSAGSPAAGSVVRVDVPEQPKAEHLSRDRAGRRRVTFPKITVKNPGRQDAEIRFLLFVGGLSGWDPAYLPIFESPGLWVRDLGRSLPPVIRLAPGEQISGKVEFRVPFSEPSEKEMFCRLLMLAPPAELKIDEWTVPLTFASYVKLPPDPPSSTVPG